MNKGLNRAGRWSNELRFPPHLDASTGRLWSWQLIGLDALKMIIVGKHGQAQYIDPCVRNANCRGRNRIKSSQIEEKCGESRIKNDGEAITARKLLWERKRWEREKTSEDTAQQNYLKASPMNFHFVLILAALVNKSGSAHCLKDFVKRKHLF